MFRMPDFPHIQNILSNSWPFHFFLKVTHIFSLMQSNAFIEKKQVLFLASSNPDVCAQNNNLTPAASHKKLPRHSMWVAQKQSQQVFIWKNDRGITAKVSLAAC